MKFRDEYGGAIMVGMYACMGGGHRTINTKPTGSQQWVKMMKIIVTHLQKSKSSI